MMIRSESKGGTDIFSDMMLFKENVNKQNEMLILKSRSMMARVVDSLGLQFSYYVTGNVKSTNIYKESPFQVEFLTPPGRGMSLEVHFLSSTTYTLGMDVTKYVVGQPVNYAGFNFRLALRESPYSNLSVKDFLVTYMPRESAAMAYMGGLNIQNAADMGGMLQISYVTENPMLGADIVNTLMEQYRQNAIEDKNETNRKIVSFINDRLNIVERQLDSVEKELQQFKSREQVIDLPTQSQRYFENLVTTREDVRKLQIQVGTAELLEDYLKDGERKLTLVPSTLGLQDLTLMDLVNGYNRLIADRTLQLQTGATVNSPAIRNLESDIEAARQRLLLNLANIKAGFRKTIVSLETQSTSFNTEIAAIPQKERESRERLRQQEIKQTLYLFMLQKREESGIAEASTISDSKVIDAALPLSYKVSPVSSRIYAIAALAGLFIPLVVIYIILLMNDKVITKSDITKATDLPILGEIGHNYSDRTLLFPEKSRTVVAEQTRILRSNLRFVLGESFDRFILLVTSSFSGEGKSFITTNLAAAMALSGKRTVILEFDLRKPKVIAGLGLQKGHGLTNYLVGGAKLEQLPQPVPNVPNLFAISCGPVPPNPAEILLTPRIQDLFTWLRTEFDIIIIDTAPVGLVSDAISLSQHADATLYVIRQRHTFKRQLLFIDDLYQQNKLPKMGLVVNDVVSKGASKYYGYGGHYGYGYGYGYGSQKDYYDIESKSFWDRISWKRKRKK
ncbi:MAG: polysaccharide biosynthesis tyrosine autokinase [Candidatus Pseudobacter hemicellulosilyticus]|uniref:Polysaccharide biosynthesis tyrosine autokinase n=1 Tax=Candidatus Pseudobacter hemicellulosilyticus TaxID=3121375 RepID=A0AAJ6BI58_9BACT|nr:MAG: polysaccharide biosynthesis tyrosine autokinase [Pseudobacter sp.]